MQPPIDETISSVEQTEDNNGPQHVFIICYFSDNESYKHLGTDIKATRVDANKVAEMRLTDEVMFTEKCHENGVMGPILVYIDLSTIGKAIKDNQFLNPNRIDKTSTWVKEQAMDEIVKSGLEPTDLYSYHYIVDGHGSSNREDQYFSNDNPDNQLNISYFAMARIIKETTRQLKEEMQRQRKQAVGIETDITLTICHSAANENIQPDSTIISPTTEEMRKYVDNSNNIIEQKKHNTKEVIPFATTLHKKWGKIIPKEDNIVKENPTKKLAQEYLHSREVYLEKGAAGLMMYELNIKDQSINLKAVDGVNYIGTGGFAILGSIAEEVFYPGTVKDGTAKGENSRLISYNYDADLHVAEDVMEDMLSNIEVGEGQESRISDIEPAKPQDYRDKNSLEKEKISENNESPAQNGTLHSRS